MCHAKLLRDVHAKCKHYTYTHMSKHAHTIAHTYAADPDVWTVEMRCVKCVSV